MAGGPLTRTQMVSQLSRAYPATVMVDAGGALLVRGREVLVAELRTAGSVEVDLRRQGHRIIDHPGQIADVDAKTDNMPVRHFALDNAQAAAVLEALHQ